MKLVIAATGASGTVYLQRLLEQIDCEARYTDYRRFEVTGRIKSSPTS